MPKVVWVDPETGKQNTKSFSYDKEGRADAQAYAKKVDGRVEDKKVTRQGDDGPILEGFRELLSRMNPSKGIEEAMRTRDNVTRRGMNAGEAWEDARDTTKKDKWGTSLRDPSSDTLELDKMLAHLMSSGTGQTPGDYMQSTMPSGSELTGRVPRVPPADNRDIVNEGVKDYSKVQRLAYYPKDPRQFEIRTGRVQGPHISDVDDENPRLKRRRR